MLLIQANLAANLNLIVHLIVEVVVLLDAVVVLELAAVDMPRNPPTSLCYLITTTITRPATFPLSSLHFRQLVLHF